MQELWLGRVKSNKFLLTPNLRAKENLRLFVAARTANYVDFSFSFLVFLHIHFKGLFNYLLQYTFVRYMSLEICDRKDEIIYDHFRFRGNVITRSL